MAKRQSGAFAARWLAKDGEDGLGISRTEVRYQIGDSGTVAPTGTWLVSPPAPVKGKYLWTRTIIYYTNGTWNQLYSVSYYGEDGDNGLQGPAGPYPIRKKWVVGDTHTRNQHAIDHIYVERGSREDSDWYVRTNEGSITAGQPPAKALTEQQLELLGYIRITSSYTTLATDVFIANESNIGGLVIKDYVFFSQLGRVGNTHNVIYSGQPGFESYFEIDGVTGNVRFARGTFEGEIIGKSGAIGDWSIVNGALTTNSALAKILMELTGNRFLRINDNLANEVLAIRADNNVGINLSTYTKGIALQILANTNSTAIISRGHNYFLQRDGDRWSSPGILGVVNTTYGMGNRTDNKGGNWSVYGVVFTPVFVSDNLVRIEHNLGHNDYAVTIDVAGQDAYGYVTSKDSAQFALGFSSAKSGHRVTITIIGRNKNMDLANL